MNENCLVSIVCTTYNHEQYVRSALDGFLLQKTNFTFEIIVHDDASTDETPRIIKEYESKYPNLFRCIYRKENWFSQGKNIWEYLFLNVARGKYIAICEGDDYWIDSLKLQKQVDFLEKHDDYGMIYTKAQAINIEKGIKNIIGDDVVNFHKLLSRGNKIPTLTVCLRKILLDNYSQLIDQASKVKWKMVDYPMWLFCSHKMQIKFLDDITGVYRIVNGSASHSISIDNQIEFTNSVYDIRRYFLINFYEGVDSAEIERVIEEDCLWEHFRYNIISHNLYRANEILRSHITQFSFVRRWVGLLVMTFGLFRKMMEKRWRYM